MDAISNIICDDLSWLHKYDSCMIAKDITCISN